jgi:hypothetical protein
MNPAEEDQERGKEMSERFKKGQMITKRLNLVDVHRKHRHCWVFGCDVEVNGKHVTAVTNGPVIRCTNTSIKRRKKGPIEKSTSVISNVCIFNASIAVDTGVR